MPTNPTAEVIHGDSVKELSRMKSASVDAVVTDPPYAEVERDYGRWTEQEWWDLMMPLCKEIRRVLKPTGSAVFVLQPNSEYNGKMRPWFFRFLLWVCEEWNMVQDAWWWNPTAMPSSGATSGGLLRGSLKGCVWAGPPDCYRDQDSVLWRESDANKMLRVTDRFTGRKTFPSGHSKKSSIYDAAARRGGTTPFNVLPVSNSGGGDSAGAHGHGAGTPLFLMRWWVRYICPPGGLVLDPFGGSGTAALAALREGRSAVLVEQHEHYVKLARKRIARFQEGKLPEYLRGKRSGKPNLDAEQPKGFF